MQTFILPDISDIMQKEVTFIERKIFSRLFDLKNVFQRRALNIKISV